MLQRSWSRVHKGERIKEQMNIAKEESMGINKEKGQFF